MQKEVVASNVQGALGNSWNMGAYPRVHVALGVGECIGGGELFGRSFYASSRK